MELWLVVRVSQCVPDHNKMTDWRIIRDNCRESGAADLILILQSQTLEMILRNEICHSETLTQMMMMMMMMILLYQRWRNIKYSWLSECCQTRC